MANKSFKISGQLDISNIISNTEKLRNALKSSLDTASFQKIEKEFDKLAQAQAAYQQAMRGSFANQSDIKAANKAIADFQKTYAKLSSTVQATLNTKGINISGDLSKGFEEERKAIEAERQRIAKATKEWKAQIQNALTGSSFSKSDQQALARSIFSEEEFKKQIERIKKESGKAFSDMRAEIEGQKANLTTKQGEITSYTDEQKRQTFLSASQQTEYGKLQSKKGVKETALSQQTTDLKKLEKEYNDTQKAYEQRIEGLRNLESALQQERMLAANAAQKEAQYRQQHPGATTRNNAELNRLANQTKMRRAAVQGAQARLNDYAKGDTVKSLEEDRKKSEQKLNTLRISITNLEAEIQSLTAQTDTLDQIADTNANARLSDITTQLDALEQRLNAVNTEESAQNQQLQDIEHSYNADHPIDENTEALEQREQALNEQIDAARRAAVENSGLNKTLEETSESIRENTEESQKNVDEMDELIDSQNKVNEAFDNMKNSIKTFLSIGSAITGIKQIIQQTFNDIKELDKSFAEIAMVTEYSVQQMWQSYDQYAEMANRLGQSTQSVIQASGLFYQQGLDTEESLALTEDTMKLATLAGLDFAEATSQMTAALRGFHLEMDEGARVTDVYSELAAKAAADVQGIAYAMSKTASIASSAGMEFETTSAFLTQMIETTQEAPENIGTAMKTIIARFTELKENVAGTADSEFDDLDYNKVDTALKSVGVSLKDTNGQFRDLDDVFLELSKKWNTLDRNSQRYIATIAAGSRQQSRFIAMMENYDRTIELVNTAYNSAGRASEQFAKYQDTVEYKVNQIQNSWEQLRTNFFNSDTYKGALDILKNFINALNNMDVKQFLGIGIIGLTLGKTVITNFIKSLQSSTQSITTSFGAILSNGIKKIKTNSFSSELQNKFNESMRKVKLEAPTQALQQAGVETSSINQKNSELLLKYVQEKQQLSEIKKEMQLLEAKGTDISEDELQRLNYLRQQTEELKKQKKETASQLMNDRITPGQIDQASRDQNLNRRIAQGQTLSKVKSSLGTAGTDALSSGITTALMMAISGADFSTVIETAGISALSAAIPSIISAVIPLISSILTGPVGIGVLLTTILVGSFVAIEKASEKAKRAELNRLSEIENANKELQKQNDSLVNSFKNSISAQEKFQKSIDTINKLQNKRFLTSQEQLSLDESVSYLEDNYEGLIEKNELTGHFTIIETKLDEIENNTKKEQQEDIANVYKNINKQEKNIEDRIEKREEIMDDLDISKSNLKGIEGYAGFDYGNKKAVEPTDDEVAKVYANVGYAFSAIKDNLSDLKTIYGEQLNLNEIFGINNFEELINSNVDYYQLVDDLNASGVSTEKIIEGISNLKNVLDSIDNNQKDIDKEAAIRDTLLLQGWDETSAAIASYAGKGFTIGDNKDIENDIEKARNKGDKDFLNNIKEGNFSIFGANSELYKEAFGMLGYGDGQDQKELKKLFSSGTNIVKWDELTPEMRSTIESVTGQNGDNWDRKSSKEMADTIQKVLSSQLIAIDEIWSEEDQQLLDENKNNFYNLSEKLSDTSNKTFSEYSKDINEFVNKQDNPVKKAMERYLNESEDSIYKQWNEYIAALGNSDGGLGLSKDIIDKIDYTGAQQLSESLSGLNLSEYAYKRISEHMNKTFSSLDADVINILSDISLDDLSSLSTQSSQEYIEQLTNATNDAAYAQELFYNYIYEMKLITRSGMHIGKESVSILKDQYNEQLKNFKQKFSPIFDANNEMLENEGTISSDTYFSLIEAGFEDYVEITTNGYELIADKAEEAWTAQAMAPLKELREDIKLNKQFLDDAQKMSKEDWSVTYWQGNSDMSISSIDNAISQYIKNEKKFEGATEQLTDAQKRYIEAIVSAGYTTEKEYIKALQEGTAALENMEPDTWIQGLISLQEASSEAAEKVNDLKDELADLEEQLIEDKEAIDEAAQALHEAKFGTEDFQSGLDGLINYERPLELINKQLENLKENLTDVSNIEEASAAMNQVADLYEDKMATLQAESKVIDQSLANIRQELLANYSKYISFDENGLAKVDFSYEDMRDSDIIKTDGLEKLIEEYNSTYDMALDKEQEYLDAQKEFDKLKSEARDKYITMEQNVIDIIKEQMQEEIDAVTDKYEALEEADNNYLDALQEAIDKQRELRDQENQYEDLATKEKKLALMQRDTSGANKKEAMSLEKDIEDNRQNLLDKEVDNLIDSMKELYDKQKEARELEIEAMEAATENMQLINETALNIISGFTNVEDYQSWLLENNSSVKDMTVAQTEQYLEGAKEEFAGYAQYVSLTTEEIKLKTDEINQKADEMFTNTSENITNIGTVIQEAAEKAKQEAIDDAQEAYDEAVEKMDDTQKKITETKEALDKAEDAAVTAHGAAMDEMVKASESAMLKVATAGTEMMIEAEALDLSNSKDVQEFAKTHNFYNEKTGEYSRSFVDALVNKGYDTSSMTVDKEWQITGTPINGGPTIYLPGTFSTKAEAEAALPEYLNKYSDNLKNLSVTAVIGSEVIGAYKKYATGGLVDYTGLAQVDGTPNKPEAFLSAEDTARIGAAAKLLADLPIFNATSNAENAVSTNIGDTSIEIHINVENISDDYDVDQMIERVKQDIVDVAKPIGTSVILNK